MAFRSLGLLSAALLFIAGCTSSPDADQPNDASAEDGSPTGVYENADWSYAGDTGPAQWAELSPVYATCAGERQSPIDLTDATTAAGPALGQAYTPAAAEVVDTGHGLQVNTGGGTLTVGSVTYDLLQFHVHTPSEHTVDGSDYPAELHFVHQAGDSLAVVGVFVEEGRRTTGMTRGSSRLKGASPPSSTTSTRSSPLNAVTTPMADRSPRRPAARSCAGWCWTRRLRPRRISWTRSATGTTAMPVPFNRSATARCDTCRLNSTPQSRPASPHRNHPLHDA